MARTKGSRNKTTAEIKELIDRVAKRRGGLSRVVGRLFELADGVECVDLKDGEERVYSKPPNEYAIRTILEYRFGKPAQRVEMSGPDGGPVRFVEDMPK